MFDLDCLHVRGLDRGVFNDKIGLEKNSVTPKVTPLTVCLRGRSIGDSIRLILRPGRLPFPRYVRFQCTILTFGALIGYSHNILFSSFCCSIAALVPLPQLSSLPLLLLVIFLFAR